MARDVESLILTMSADIRQLKRGMDEASGVFDRKARQIEKRQRELDRNLERMGASIGDGIKKASLVAQVSFAAIVGYSVKAAASAVEMKNAFQVAFGAGAQGAEEFAKSLADKVGRSQLDVMEGMTKLRLVLRQQSAAAADEMSKNLAARAIDLGSLFHVSDADAFAKIIAGLTGEGDGLKAFGIQLNEAAVKAELLRLGFRGNTSEASEAARVVARYNVLLAQSEVAAGDAAKTIGSTANQLKKLQGNVKDSAAELGLRFLPVADKLLTWANGALDAFNKLPEGMQNAGLAAVALVAASGPLAQLAAGLIKIIKLANEARIALALTAAAGPAAGAAGAAGVVGGAAVASGGLTLGTAAAVLSLKGDAAPRREQISDQERLNRLLANELDYRQKLAAAIARGDTANAKRYEGLVNRTHSMAGGLRLKIGIANLPSAEDGTATPKPMGLTEEQKRAVAGAGSGSSRAAKKAETIDEVRAVEALAFNETSLLDTIKEMNDQIRHAAEIIEREKSEPVDFHISGTIEPTQSTTDFINEASKDWVKFTEEAQQQWHDTVKDGFLGGLHAAADGNLMDFIKYRLREAIFEAAAEGLTQAFTKALSGAQSGAIGGLLGGALKGIGGLLGFGKIPGFAKGTNYAPGGYAVVGEDGPELVRLPRGSKVTPTSGLRAALASRGPTGMGQTTVQQFITIEAPNSVGFKELITGINGQIQHMGAMAARAGTAGALQAMPGQLQRMQRLGAG